VVAQVAQIIDVQIDRGQEVLNVFHFVNLDGAGDIIDLVTAMGTGYVANVKGDQNAGIAHTSQRYRIVSPTAELVQVYTTGYPYTGELTGEELASCDALSMKWNLGSTVVLAGGFTGHLKRGGMRLGGIDESRVNGNNCTSDIITSWIGTMFPLLSDPVDGEWLLCVASYLNGARARQDTVQAYALVTGTSEPSPSTQNTRKVLRGRTS
jgi:hypothetical protein